MNLNEYYCDLIDADNGYDNQLLADRCEKIAEDFAIRFAYYLLDKNDKPNGEFTIKELLEIYKKEL